MGPHRRRLLEQPVREPAAALSKLPCAHGYLRQPELPEEPPQALGTSQWAHPASVRNNLNPGDPGQTRTAGLLLRRQALYPLSYGVSNANSNVAAARGTEGRQGSALSAELRGRVCGHSTVCPRRSAFPEVAEARGKTARRSGSVQITAKGLPNRYLRTISNTTSRVLQWVFTPPNQGRLIRGR